MNAPYILLLSCEYLSYLTWKKKKKWESVHSAEERFIKQVRF